MPGTDIGMPESTFQFVVAVAIAFGAFGFIVVGMSIIILVRCQQTLQDNLYKAARESFNNVLALDEVCHRRMENHVNSHHDGSVPRDSTEDLGSTLPRVESPTVGNHLQGCPGIQRG